MKVVIFGASGKTGTLLTEQALAKGQQVTAYARREGAIKQKHPNLKVITGNLNDAARLNSAIVGADACFSVLGGGSLTRHAPEIVQGIDRIVSIMEAAGVRRFVYLSSIGAGESRNFMGPVIRFFIADVILRVPLADHTANERRLSESKIQWTVVRPASLTDGPRTGNLQNGNEKTLLKGNKKISRANVASFMLEQLTDTTNLNKAVWLYE